MLVAAALVIPALILESADVGEAWKTFAAVLNWAIWLAFLGELVAMLAVVRDRRGYLAHNPVNVAVVVLTPPFLPALVQSLRVLRLLRVARLLRLAPIFKLAFTLRGFEYADSVCRPRRRFHAGQTFGPRFVGTRLGAGQRPLHLAQRIGAQAFASGSPAFEFGQLFRAHACHARRVVSVTLDGGDALVKIMCNTGQTGVLGGLCASRCGERLHGKPPLLS
jgi:hypothetical protein